MNDVIEVFAKPLLPETYAEAFVPSGGGYGGGDAPQSHVFGQELPSDGVFEPPKGRALEGAISEA